MPRSDREIAPEFFGTFHDWDITSQVAFLAALAAAREDERAKVAIECLEICACYSTIFGGCTAVHKSMAEIHALGGEIVREEVGPWMGKEFGL